MSKGQIKCPAHIGRVKELPCVVCQRRCEEAHHIRTPEFTGGSQRAHDWLVMPLCKFHHDELHADKKMWEMRNGKQIDHVCRVLHRLYR